MVWLLFILHHFPRPRRPARPPARRRPILGAVVGAPAPRAGFQYIFPSTPASPTASEGDAERSEAEGVSQARSLRRTIPSYAGHE